MNKTPKDVADFYIKHYMPFCSKNKIKEYGKDNRFSAEVLSKVYYNSKSNRTAIDILDYFLHINADNDYIIEVYKYIKEKNHNEQNI